MGKALIVLDLINDIVDQKGKVGKDGFFIEANKKNILNNTKNAINYFRSKNLPVIFVVVGFSENYDKLGPNMKIFKNVEKDRQIIFDTWSTQVSEKVKPMKNEKIVKKSSISAFLNTELDVYLKELNIDSLYLTGVSSDLVILNTCFEGHDRGYKVIVLEDCISSNDKKSQESALHIIKKIANVKKTNNLLEKE